jgi:hypothetical protein
MITLLQYETGCNIQCAETGTCPGLMISINLPVLATNRVLLSMHIASRGNSLGTLALAILKLHQTLFQKILARPQPGQLDLEDRAAASIPGDKNE